MPWSACGARNWTRSRRPLSDWGLMAIGRIGRGAESALFQQYAKRLRPRLAVAELAEGRGSPMEIRHREADVILAGLHPGDWVVAMDMDGIAPSSERLAALLSGWLEQSRPLRFVIGGAEGLDSRVLARADAILSLGALTWPHLLARVMLVEQLFRARAIAAGHPYHRSGRPGKIALKNKG